jgi:hypothetical protein
MNDATLTLLRNHLQAAVPPFIYEFLVGERHLSFSAGLSVCPALTWSTRSPATAITSSTGASIPPRR